MARHFIPAITTLVTAVTFPSFLLVLPATAGQLSNGQTFFDHPPELVRTATSNLASGMPATYEFTLVVPADAGNPLQAVTISQNSAAEQVDFDISQSVAYGGDRTRLSLASVGGTQPTHANEITLVFDPPIQPGKTVTIALAAQRNPSLQGTYLFGVTAYPAGEKGTGLLVGQGRLHVYNNSR